MVKTIKAAEAEKEAAKISAERKVIDAQAQKDSVDILRERIKMVRKFKDSLDDPLAALPVGLGKMKLAELQDEAHKRELPVAPDATRVQLRMLIRSVSDNRFMQSTLGQSAMGAVVDEDFEMVAASKAKAKPNPKSKGYPSRA